MSRREGIIANNRHRIPNLRSPYLRHLHSAITNDEKALGKAAAETECKGASE